MTGNRKHKEAAADELPAELAPEIARQMLTELTVHQSELEAQNQSLRKAHRELDASRARYLKLYELAPVGYCTINATTKTVDYNLAAARLLGLEASELANQPLERFLHSEDQALFADYKARLLEQAPPRPLELRMVQGDEQVLWVQLTATIVPQDGFNVTLVALNDISERRKIELALEDRERKLALIFETMLDGLVIHDSSGKIIQFNPAALSILGLTANEILGRTSTDPIWRLVHEDGTSVNESNNPVLIALKLGKSIFGKVLGVQLPSGVCRWLRINVTPSNFKFTDWAESPSSRHAIVTFSDISGLIEAQAAMKRTLAVIDQSKTELKTMINGIPALVSHWDRNFNNITANNLYAKYFGISPEQLVGRNYREVLGPLFVKVESYMNQALAGKTVTFDQEMMVADKSMQRFQVTFHPDRENGEIRGFFTIAMNVTEQREAAFRFEQMANAIDEVFWMTDPQKQRMLYISPAYERIWGRPCQALYDDPLSFLNSIHPEDRERVRRSLSNQIEGTYDETYRILDAKGEVRWINDRSISIQTLANQTKRVMGVAQDISIRRKAEQALSISELRHRTLFEMSQDALMTLAPPTWHFNRGNSAACKLFGVRDEQDFITRGPWEFSPEFQPDGQRSADLAKTMIDTAMAKGLHSFEWIHKSIDGTEFIAEVTLMKMKIDDHHFLQATVRDITASKNSEKEKASLRLQMIQASKLASLGEMAAGVAHEINNPLAIISGSVNQLVKYVNHPEKFAAKIDAIERATVRIARITGGLKKFSRTSTVQAHEVRSLAKIVTESLVLTHNKVERHNTSISFQLLTEGFISCDEVEIEQVLINLINNAVDAVKNQNARWVRIETSEDDRHVILRVIDSGPGIPEAAAGKLFEPFFTTKAVGEGTGLGLSISKGILDDHKASIAVDAHFPHTCFEVRFPRARVNLET